MTPFARFRLAAVPALALALASGGSALAAPQKAADKPAEKSVEKDRNVRVIRIGGGAFLGVSLEEVGKDDVARLKLPEERGAIVTSVETGSPAEKAGLQKDDVVMAFQGDSIHTAAQLSRLVRESPAGRTVNLDVSRGGRSQRVQATLGERSRSGDWHFEMPDLDIELPEPPLPPDAPEAPRAPLLPRMRAPRAFGPDFFMGAWGGPRKLGIQYQEVGEQLAKYFRLADDRGVLVSDVEPDGPAAKAGMQAGDVILKVGERSVRDGDDLRSALSRSEPGSEVGIQVQRDGKPVELKVTLGGSEQRRKQRRGPSA
ncbi:MAG: PDZ domain-containing protein [Vicinamibacteria bacterium]